MKTQIQLNNLFQGEIQLINNGFKVGYMEIAVVESRITVYKTVTVLDDERKNEYYSLLLDHLVNYTRENTLKIIPLCSYISNCFKNNPYKYKDIWLNV